MSLRLCWQSDVGGRTPERHRLPLLRCGQMSAVTLLRAVIMVGLPQRSHSTRRNHDGKALNGSAIASAGVGSASLQMPEHHAAVFVTRTQQSQCAGRALSPNCGETPMATAAHRSGLAVLACPVCGAEFRREANKHKLPRSQTCSSECSHKWRALVAHTENATFPGKRVRWPRKPY